MIFEHLPHILATLRAGSGDTTERSRKGKKKRLHTRVKAKARPRTASDSLEYGGGDSGLRNGPENHSLPSTGVFSK